jgi:hypothetical protein
MAHRQVFGGKNLKELRNWILYHGNFVAHGHDCVVKTEIHSNKKIIKYPKRRGKDFQISSRDCLLFVVRCRWTWNGNDLEFSLLAFGRSRCVARAMQFQHFHENFAGKI